MIKNPFKKLGAQSRQPESEPTVDDLIILERYDEAIKQLRQRLKSRPHELHTRYKLADVLGKTGRGSEALEEYATVAQGFADDGFEDKALAVIHRGLRLAPGDPALMKLQHRFKEAQELQATREATTQALHHAFEQSGELKRNEEANLRLRVQRVWEQLSKIALVKQIGPEQARRLFSGVGYRRYAPQQVIYRAGEQAEELALILKGEIRALGHSGQELRNFGPGKIIGDAALFEHKRWPARYVALVDTELLVLDRPGFEKVIVGNPDPPGILSLLRGQKNDTAVSDLL